MYTLQNFPHRQLALAMDVFESFHVRGIHPSDHFALADISVRHGVFQDEDEALDWLEGDECDEDVKRSYSVARKLGIGGVPFLVFQEKYAGSGAMGIDGFTDVSCLYCASGSKGLMVAARGGDPKRGPRGRERDSLADVHRRES